jgi:hypothetical protein
MAIFQLISFLLIALLLMTMFSKARPWSKNSITGKLIKTVPMNFWQRARYHRSSLLALGTALIFGLATGWLPMYLAGMVSIFSLGILWIPMQYTFTTKGVGIGEASFRTWDEFTGVKRQPAQIVLQHASYFGRVTLFVKPAEIDSVVTKIFPNRFQIQSS